MMIEYWKKQLTLLGVVPFPTFPTLADLFKVFRPYEPKQISLKSVTIKIFVWFFKYNSGLQSAATNQ